ncbi:MAG: N-acetyltransferase [Elusimicrobia bacterium CG08_land_8_20_14_0_20_51_18]|nr:MAG: N-acetyltransferase [Elusimicrobia bacterium CG08_land_8_20_14_0_20_51_18]
MLRLKLIKRADDRTLSQIISIYKEQGWWTASDNKKRLGKFISGSRFFLTALDGGKVIGMGRAISDSANDAYIQDLAVLKAFRKKKIGGKMVDFLVKKLKKEGFRWIGLIAQDGTYPFYEKRGFKVMKNSHPMVYGKL